MQLMDLVSRTRRPIPWAEGENIPWSDPEFSRRMLAEHLSQAHNAASRRTHKIDAHVAWLVREVLGTRPADVLDLACGPGLYAKRLCALGHRCVGIDYSPASIDHAKAYAAPTSRFVHGDIRTTPYGSGYELALLIFGELNVFTRDDAQRILHACRESLKPGGRLVVEPHTYAAVEKIGRSAAVWHSLEQGLFSERPHVHLRESFWDDAAAVATTRYFTIDAETSDVTSCAASMQAYTENEYRDLFRVCGFDEVEFRQGLGDDEELGVQSESDAGLFAIIATRN